MDSIIPSKRTAAKADREADCGGKTQIYPNTKDS
jgi:hypothetical protein